ncbi:MAG TPA: hypothetical protein VML94_01650 [Thermoplasmata archaeon]|nr:hypothetical protein [Thermoplasmata archaeon]
MVTRGVVLGFAVVVLLLLGTGAAGATGATRAAAPTYPPVHGTVNGPTVVATSSNSTYYLNGSGGPAIAPNGTQVGSLSWKAKISGNDLSGVSLSPNASTFQPGTPGITHLKVAKVTEALTITVEIQSVYLSSNATTNVTYTVQVVVPYLVHAQLVVGPHTSVLGFDVTVELDGAVVGTVHVPAIAANGTYNLTYAYATTGLSVGEHTFTISLANEHGLVRFAGGAIEYSQSFYVVGPAPDYALYVLAGVVVFAGVLFIFVTRVAARRRPSATRK